MTFRNLFSLLSLAAVLMFVGCGKLPDEKTEKAADADAHSEADHLDEHAHPTEGPHHGTLIELGKEEYHAELVHDEKAGTVTVYLLGPAAKKPVPIEAEDVAINVSHEGQPEQFQLAAKPEAGDPAGKSSRFVSQDPELIKHLDEENTKARLALKIEGKSFNGEFSHEHEHDHDHDHDHGHAEHAD